MNIFNERKEKLITLKGMRSPSNRLKNSRIKICPECEANINWDQLKKNLFVCHKCGYHLRMPAKYRLRAVFDKKDYSELFDDIASYNPIDFPGYDEKLGLLREKTGLSEACVCADGLIGGNTVVCAVLDNSFLMGSMGTAVGEKITCCAEWAIENETPLIIFSSSGGARMQEGIFSLMQMAKTSAAIKRFSDAGGLFISYLTHPTTGGVTASFASLGDITLAEPQALIGFAGSRVIEQTINEKLPEGFQSSEFQLEHGFVDSIVKRSEMRNVLIQLINLHKR